MKIQDIVLYTLILVILVIPSNFTQPTLKKSEDFSPFIGYVSALANDIKFEEELQPNNPIEKCTCNGTKMVKSGDGIQDIPCPCGDNCKCNTNETENKDNTRCNCGCNKKHCKCQQNGKSCISTFDSIAMDLKDGEIAKDYYCSYMFTASWCGPCQKFKKEEKKVLEDNGWVFLEDKWVKGCSVLIIDIEKNPEIWNKFSQEKDGVKPVPQFVIVKNNKVIGEPIIGYVNWKTFSSWYNKTITDDRSK